MPSLLKSQIPRKGGGYATQEASGLSRGGAGSGHSLYIVVPMGRDGRDRVSGVRIG